jgi:hypothetical protein
LQLLRQHHDAERFVLSVRELREHERVQLVFKKFVIPTERVFRATEESAVELIYEGFGKGMASAVPNRNQTSTALAAEVNKS